MILYLDTSALVKMYREAERDRLTLGALASADAGRLIDHERVEEWLDSLGSPEAKPLPQP